MLSGWPDDFTYVLGLQEAVVVGMADGYAQASGRPTLVNLHTAPGVGNAMGAIFNAQANHSPLVITAGQQVRAAITMQANLTNRDAIRMTHPLVKWSYEPPRAEDVPMRSPARPTWRRCRPRTDVRLRADGRLGGRGARGLRAGGDRAAHRRPHGGRPGGDRGARAAPGGRLRPGPRRRSRRRRRRGWDAAVALAERQRLPVFAIPAPGGGRLGFPEGHPNFRGVLPPAIGPVSETLAAHDLVLVAGASVFAYYPTSRGRCCPRAPNWWRSPRPRRGGAGADGRGDRGGRRPHARAPRRGGRRIRSRPGDSLPDPVAGPEQDPITGTAAMNALAAAFPDDGIIVLEAPSATLALRNQLRISRPGATTSAPGRARLRLSAAVGVQLAEPDRPVICVVGEGSVQYAVTAFWSAVAYDAPVTFLVLRNDEYAILKWFSDIEGVSGAPGLDLPGLDTAAIATATASARCASSRRTSCARPSGARSPRAGRSWSRPGSPRGCGCSSGTRSGQRRRGARVGRAGRRSRCAPPQLTARP